ncbi:MAG: cytoplasmic protein [Vicinamibacteraceae bacterium]
MTRKTLVLSAIGAIVVGVALSAFHQGEDPLDPVLVAPDSHKIAFENIFVRVLEVRVRPGSIEPRHRHPHGLSVYFASQDTKITVDGRAPQVGHREAGSFAWSDAVVHTVENVGSTDMHVLRIELKQ